MTSSSDTPREPLDAASILIASHVISVSMERPSSSTVSGAPSTIARAIATVSAVGSTLGSSLTAASWVSLPGAAARAVDTNALATATQPSSASHVGSA